ncbi:MAG: hypothetical protein ACKPGT_10805, partial [Microcystis sp.]
GNIWVDPESEKRYQWEERWLVIKSNALASRQIKGLESRLVKGEKALLLDFPRINILAMAKSLTEPELKQCNTNKLLGTNS